MAPEAQRALFLYSSFTVVWFKVGEIYLEILTKNTFYSPFVTMDLHALNN